MRLTIPLHGMGDRSVRQIQKHGQTEERKDRKTFYGGDLKLTDDPIAQRKKKAQEQAWKIVENAWKNDESVDKTIQSHKEDYAAKMDVLLEKTASISDAEQDKEVLKRLYEVEDGSLEEKDLAILEKLQSQRAGLSQNELTPEEMDRYCEIKEKPLTEYQERALEINDREIQCKKEIKEAADQMQMDTRSVQGIQLERLKSHPMVDAEKAADAVKKAASDEIIGMLKQDALDHMEEIEEENEEKAKEKREDDKEEEERLAQLEEKLAVQEALTEKTEEAAEKAKEKERQNDAPDTVTDDMEEITKKSSQSGDVQKSLKDIKSSMKVLEADLKGIKVDEEV